MPGQIHPSQELPVQATGNEARASDTEAILAAIVESSDDAIISKDLDGIITSWNRAAERIFGYSASEVVGSPISILIPENRKDEEPRILKRIQNGETIDHYETVRQCKDGRLIDISLTVSPVVNSSGEIIGASKIARDITQRKFADKQLARLAAIVESSDDAIISKDLNGKIMTWNDGAEALFGYSAEEAIGAYVNMLIPKDLVNEEPMILERIGRGEKIDHYETIRRRKDGKLVHISLTVSPLFDPDGNVVGASKIARDMTDRLAAETERREKEIMARLLKSQEAERNRIARDLHDHLGQKMTGLRLKLETLSGGWDGNSKRDKLFNEIRDIASGIDRDIGFLSWELRPTELENVGIEGALRSFVREWATQYDIRAEFQSNVVDPPKEGGRRPHPDIETHLYRFLQEALNNVLKHAAAEFVSVLYVVRDSEIGLAVEDNGRGFDLEAQRSKGNRSHTLGLTSMRERIALMRGHLEIETSPGAGTSLLARVPYQPAVALDS
jgi:PAS domain S-box-containing protein